MFLSCLYCDEPVYSDEPTREVYAIGRGSVTCHLECVIRSVMGSVGHQNGECECHGKTDTSEDGLKPREAARRAYNEFKRRQGP